MENKPVTRISLDNSREILSPRGKFLRILGVLLILSASSSFVYGLTLLKILLLLVGGACYLLSLRGRYRYRIYSRKYFCK